MIRHIPQLRQCRKGFVKLEEMLKMVIDVYDTYKIEIMSSKLISQTLRASKEAISNGQKGETITDFISPTAYNYICE